MLKEADDFHQSVRNALRNAPAVWTPQCPEQETLLDWVEREEAHPQAVAMLEHLLGCAYCRREHAALREVRALSPTPRIAPKSAATAARIGAWVGELIATAFTAPATLVGALLESLDRLAAQPALAVTRGAVAPTDLQPAFTALRTLRPTLRWSDAGTAREYTVLVTRHTGQKKSRLIWESSTSTERGLVLPEQANLEPGGIYLWQVTARTGGQETVSAPAAFAVLGDRARRQVEALEQQTEEATLERISLYEAFGLYDEALHQAELFAAAHESDALARTIQDRLRDRPYG